MGQLIVRNLEDDVIARLKQRAAASNLSLEQTIRNILISAAGIDREDLVRRLDALRALGPTSHSDSTELIREERESDGRRS